MQGEAGVEVEAASAWTPTHRGEANPDWRMVDRALRTIAKRRAALDADEARWLRQAEALQIWRPLGMVSALDYLERVLGYAPRTAQDRLRVARSLGPLPELTAALTRGELSFSAVRELTRVATPATEASWTAAALGKSLRQIEELVADHRPGDRPDDPPDPEARTHVVRFELSAETFALLRQVRTIVDDEHGENLPDDPFVAALCGAVLDGTLMTDPTGRAKFQIAVTVCERCGHGWQEGAGAKIAISPAAVERARCDAQHIGSLDGDAPERAHQDIPPSVARFVWRRDGGRCRLPGCRSARGLELHHLIHRADGGSHDASNLVLACSSCHQAHHAGALTITGTADHLEVRRAVEVCVSAPAKPPSVAAMHAHVGAPAEPQGLAESHAAVRAPDEPAPVRAPAEPSATVETGARVGAFTAPSGVVSTGAHVGAPTAPSSIVKAGAPVGVFTAPSGVVSTGAHVGAPSRLDVAVLRTQTKDALIGLGWKPAIAHAAVVAASAAAGPEMTLERLIFEALRRCPGGDRDARASARAP